MSLSSEEMQVGSFYEINHAMFLSSAKYPDQLNLIRVVMVSEKTGVRVSLRFPSIYSLRIHFKDSGSASNRTREGSKNLPHLDEKHVMSLDVATHLLLRRVSPSEFAEKKDSWSFWAVNSSCSPTVSFTNTSSPPTAGINNFLPKRGLCWSELKCGGMLRWGKRRQVRFLSRHDHESNFNPNTQSQTARDDDGGTLKEHSERGKEVEVDNSDEREQEQNKMAMCARSEGLKEEEDEEEEEDIEEETDEDDGEEDFNHRKQTERTPKQASRLGRGGRRTSGRKRKSCETGRTRQLKRAKQENAKKQVVIGRASKNKRKMIKASIDRWSAERYKLAEENMLKILKEKGAVYGNPILRPALRMEARKLIGDTGLLDHLLKHMAGKVAPGGAERFRRRHNADGAMEYWLESADLMNIRKEAGIEDPFWNPPPGWKPGDSPSQDPVCAKEIRLLRREITKLKREMQELVSKNQEESLAIVTYKPTDEDSDDLSRPLKEMYTELLRKRSAMEEQLTEISKCLSMVKLMQEDMEGFKSVGEGTETTDLEEPITPAGMEGGERIMVGEEKKKAGDGVVVALPGEDKVVEVVQGQEEKNMKRTGREDKAARIERLKSGFRICKPQGTFLWPNTMSLLLSSSSPSPQFAVEDLVLVPTPTPLPSSPPSHRSRHHHHLLQSPTPTSDGGVSSAALLPASPVKPLAEKRTLPLATGVPLVPETAMPPIHSAATKATKQTPSMSHPASPATEGALIAIESVSPKAQKPSASSLVKHESAQANATLVINLNELPNNTSSASSLTYKRRYHNATIASSSSSAIISSSVVEVAVKQWEEGDDIIQQLKKQKKAQQQQGSCSPSLPSSSRDCLFEGGGGPSPSPSSWLALATTTPHASSSSDSLAPPTDGLI